MSSLQIHPSCFCMFLWCFVAWNLKRFQRRCCHIMHHRLSQNYATPSIHKQHRLEQMLALQSPLFICTIMNNIQHVITCFYSFFCCTIINIHHCPPRIRPSQRQLGLASSGTIRHWHMVEVAVLSPRNINDNQCPWPEISSDIHGHRYDMIWWYVT